MSYFPFLFSCQFILPTTDDYSPTDKCNKLPDIQNLGTSTQFPVPYDTPVTVQCGVGYSLVGDNVITCIKGDRYSTVTGQQPSCKESESNIVTLPHLTSFSYVQGGPIGPIAWPVIPRWGHFRLDERSIFHLFEEFFTYSIIRGMDQINITDKTGEYASYKNVYCCHGTMVQWYSSLNQFIVKMISYVIGWSYAQYIL